MVLHTTHSSYHITGTGGAAKSLGQESNSYFSKSFQPKLMFRGRQQATKKQTLDSGGSIKQPQEFPVKYIFQYTDIYFQYIFYHDKYFSLAELISNIKTQNS